MPMMPEGFGSGGGGVPATDGLDNVQNVALDALNTIGGDAQQKADQAVQSAQDAIHKLTIDKDSYQLKISKDKGAELFQNAMEAPRLRAQLDQINSVLQQQMEHVQRQRDFMTQHPILTVLAQVGAAAAQDRRMPPITQAIGRVTQSLYPSDRELSGEQLGILKEALASSSQEERLTAAAMRLQQQNDMLDVKKESIVKGYDAAIAGLTIKEKEAEIKRLNEESLAARRTAQTAEDKVRDENRNKHYQRMDNVASAREQAYAANVKSQASLRAWRETQTPGGGGGNPVSAARGLQNDAKENRVRISAYEAQIGRARAGLITLPAEEKAKERDRIINMETDLAALKAKQPELDAGEKEAGDFLRKKLKEEPAKPKNITIIRDANGNLVAQ